MIDVRELSNMLAERAPSIAQYLLPNGRQSGREWEVGSVHGEAGKSLKVCISGDKRGKWKDFASGEGGDLIDLWQQVKGLSLSEAIKDVKGYLGINEPTFTRPKRKTYTRPRQPVSDEVGVGSTSAVAQYLSIDRGLHLDCVSRYKVCERRAVGPMKNWKVQREWAGPWIVFHSIRDNELVGVKYLHVQRRDGKKQTLVEPNCEPTCFGWHVIDKNARSVVICEGELDAISLYQYGHPAVSVPFGGGKGDKQQWIDYDWEKLEQFETVYLCMDKDAEGDAAVEEIATRLGVHRVLVVTLPFKDANECLVKGVPKEDIDNAFTTAEPLAPHELRSAKTYYAEVLDEFYPADGILPGWDIGLDGVGFRFLRGEVTVATGVNGHGKSLLWGQLMAHAILQGERACVASLEMTPKKTLYRMVRQACGASRPRHTEIEDCLTYWEDKLWLFDLVGTGKIERLLEVFRYAYRRHGVRQFVIDSLMKCGVAEDDYKAQKDLIDRLCDFVNETSAHVHLIAHPRKADDETPPGKMDIKGTGAISDLAFNTFTLWRNKPKEQQLAHYRETGELPRGVKSVEEIQERFDGLFWCHKSRNVEDAEGMWKLYYHQPSMRFLRRPTEPIRPLYKVAEGEVPF